MRIPSPEGFKIRANEYTTLELGNSCLAKMEWTTYLYMLYYGVVLIDFNRTLNIDIDKEPTFTPTQCLLYCQLSFVCFVIIINSDDG